MKYIITLALLFAITAFADDHKDLSDANKEQAEKMMCDLKDGEACTTISVPTAQCETCEKTIGTALESVDGVTMVQVDAKAKKAHVHYVSADVNITELEKAIAAVGYDANETKRDEKAHAALPQCCQTKK